MKLKTLKDIKMSQTAYQELREEAIKWVKKDLKDFGYDTLIDRWIERLNITEKDLK